jgi:hypothetical protein
MPEPVTVSVVPTAQPHTSDALASMEAEVVFEVEAVAVVELAGCDAEGAGATGTVGGAPGDLQPLKHTTTASVSATPSTPANTRREVLGAFEPCMRTS